MAIEIINAFRQYEMVGLKCVPTKQDKAPFTSESWNNGIGDENKYKESFGLGIICGDVSGGLECLDFDNHFGDAKENLSQFIEQIKGLYDLYNFPIELTMNGGYHLLYRCDGVVGNQKLAQRPKLDEKTNKFKPDCIIETRGQNGYFVAAPTPGYKVIKNDILQIPKILKEERNEIINVCRSFNEWYEIRPNEYEKGDKPGDLFNNDNVLIEVISVLELNGWKEVKNKCWSRPGKKEGISATLGKAGEKIFYVFSSNAYPFEPMHGYTPFQVIGLLKYSGDFKQFAKELAERYDLKNKQHQQSKKQQCQPKTEKELSEILKKSYIDLDIPIDKPPVALYISDTSGLQTIRKRMLTLGNFSCIIGKSKSRKTFLTTILTAAMVNNNGLFYKFWGNIPIEKRLIGYFDTEQGDYDAANNIKRIHRLIEKEPDNLAGFTLRSYTYLERCDIVEQYLKEYGKNTGLVVIDGIADLAKAINDEEEATRIVSLLLRWSKDYNCHIITILHQNKNDNFATGHLGSFIMKKAEIIISVTKEKGSDKDSVVSCDFARGIDFDDFYFNIENGLPYLTSAYSESQAVTYLDF